MIDRKAFADARAVLTEKVVPEFEPLFEDRLGDIDSLEKHADASKAHYLKAWKALEVRAPYRKYVEAKLNALGVDPAVDSTPAISIKTESK